MAKYLIEATLSADGLKGIEKDTGSGRQTAFTKSVKGLGGKVEFFDFSLGEHDVIAIVDVPDIVTVAALALHISETGLVRTKTTALISAEEMNQAIKKKVEYRAPGR